MATGPALLDHPQDALSVDRQWPWAIKRHAPLLLQTLEIEDDDGVVRADGDEDLVLIHCQTADGGIPSGFTEPFRVILAAAVAPVPVEWLDPVALRHQAATVGQHDHGVARGAYPIALPHRQHLAIAVAAHVVLLLAVGPGGDAGAIRCHRQAEHAGVDRVLRAALELVAEPRGTVGELGVLFEGDAVVLRHRRLIPALGVETGVDRAGDLRPGVARHPALTVGAFVETDAVPLADDAIPHRLVPVFGGTGGHWRVPAGEVSDDGDAAPAVLVRRAPVKGDAAGGEDEVAGEGLVDEGGGHPGTIRLDHGAAHPDPAAFPAALDGENTLRVDRRGGFLLREDACAQRPATGQRIGHRGRRRVVGRQQTGQGAQQQHARRQPAEPVAVR